MNRYVVAVAGLIIHLALVNKAGETYTERARGIQQSKVWCQ